MSAASGALTPPRAGFAPIMRRFGWQGVVWAQIETVVTVRPGGEKNFTHLTGMGAIDWECPHVHRTEAGAKRCAERHLKETV